MVAMLLHLLVFKIPNGYHIATSTNPRSCTTISPIPIRKRVAEQICRFTEMDVAWFINTGAEANEGALKIARKFTENKDYNRNMVSWKNDGCLGCYLEI